MAMTPQPPSESRSERPVVPDGTAGDATGESVVDAAALARGEQLLARGADALREEPTTRWIELSGRVLSAVRSTGRRSWPIDATWPPGATVRDGDALRVNDLVVVAHVRRRLEALADAAPTRIALRTDEHRCTGAEVTLVARYGTDLTALADQARSSTLDALRDVLGDPPEGLAREAVVDVTYSDITPGDPRA